MDKINLINIYQKHQILAKYIFKLYIVVKTAPRFRPIIVNGLLINNEEIWIIVSFDNDKINILLINKGMISIKILIE